jgi:hypothetical protein
VEGGPGGQGRGGRVGRDRIAGANI